MTRRPWKPNVIRDIPIKAEKPMRRRTRRKWKLTPISALGLINAAAMLIGSTAGLGLPDTAVSWVLLVGGVALVWKGILEEEERREERRLPPPKEPADEAP